MDRIAELDAIIAQYDLNLHPFYQDWRMGTLPTAKLSDYAGEYGQFVATIAEGWETLGELHYAEEEREHEELWGVFKTELGTNSLSNYAETAALVAAAKANFAVNPEAVGALYAFEAQQPRTSRSKLDGLNEHYTLSDDAKKYFVVHADDVAEAALLREYTLRQSDEEFARSKAACETLVNAMWKALDGIYQA
jgi:pyrroloquinoline-quinone synthase